MFNEHHDENIVSLYQSSSTCVYLLMVLPFMFCTYSVHFNQSNVRPLVAGRAGSS